MTTDQMSADERAARLEALRQRRAPTRPAPPAEPVGPTTAAAATRRRARRRHAAIGGRILAGSLSAAVALGLMGAMAHATGSNGDASTATPADTPAARAVIVIRRPDAATDVAALATPRIAATAVAPVTTSRGS